MKKSLFIFLFSVVSYILNAQTTDLSIVVEAQDLSGNPISQIGINQEFKYIVTILNGGNAVNNASFSQTLNTNLIILSAQSQNQTGGASSIDPINITGSIITGTIANMPSNASVALEVLVKAPLNLGGIASSATVSAPDTVTDTNTSNNQSVISIDVFDIPIDFTVDYTQTNPSLGTGISAWNEVVTYQVTITNNSTIEFPLESFSQKFNLESSILNGRPRIELESINCIGGTNGINCPSSLNVQDNSIQTISSISTILTVDQTINFPAGASLTFEINIRFLDPLCGIDIQQMSVSSFAQILIEHTNESSDSSNNVITPLLLAEACPEADLCVQTTQINPDASQDVAWGEQVTFQTTVCNSGPDATLMRFFLQNLTVGVDWDIISITCDFTTGPIDCSDFTLTDLDQYWQSNNFVLQPNTTIQVTTVVVFLESDDCTAEQEDNTLGHVRSGVNNLDSFILDPNINNNAESDFVLLPPLPVCEPEDYVDLSVTKTQIDPVLPIGNSPNNTTSWGAVTYEIVISNNSDQDATVAVQDYMPLGENTNTDASLISVNCVGTTGTATCFDVTNQNVGIVYDGLPQDGQPDVFWEILPEDNLILPAQSSITYEVIVDWFPGCDANFVRATNNVSIENLDGVLDNNESNNTASSIIYFAPCVDLVVQTYPEFTSVGVNNNFNWIVDITNSNTSSNAINIDFTDTLGAQFTINGTPTCNVVSGNATCISNFNVNGNTITGNISNMDPAANIQIIIPVTAPSYGGAFTNTAEAIPNGEDNEELTPETNISISNAQVIAPLVEKVFSPDQIMQGQTSTLLFTLQNLSGNPAQNNISFTDNLPTGLTIAGPIVWEDANNCTATFSGEIGDTAISVTDLTFPEGVGTCSFSVIVTSNTPGEYVNNSSNFSNLNNIDSSQASATLLVTEDTTNVDIEVLKTVNPEETAIGTEVIFTITATNIGTTEATNIKIIENLPEGYLFINALTSFGTYDESSSTWNIPNLTPNQSENLLLTVQVISAQNLLNVAALSNVNEVDRDLTNNEDFAEVLVNNCLQIPEGFSPNEDTLNDTFVIPCVEDYPINSLDIYNRYGTLIYHKDNYINQWDGKPNTGPLNQNKVLPVGTYFYTFKIEGISNVFTGYVYLNY
ncbi:MAG: DUF11 domain-containing protein [Mesoflavibacter sp.]|nr:DUF11 domain-containing protein [Mesoflavibacter sp.]